MVAGCTSLRVVAFAGTAVTTLSHVWDSASPVSEPLPARSPVIRARRRGLVDAAGVLIALYERVLLPRSRGAKPGARDAGPWQDTGVDIDVVVTVIAGILLVVAAVGTIYPVLPGSPVAIVTLIAWGWILGSAASWTAAIVGALIAAVGWSASAVLTGRKLKQHEVPKRSILVAVVGALIGMYLIPIIGVFVGFAVGLFASELVRRRDVSSALRASGEAMKATGIGILIEFCLVCVASSVWALGVIAHFALR